VSGEVVAVNGAIPEHWDELNKDAFAAWLYRLKPAAPDELNGLLDAVGYASTAESST
jgi:glycine cleavage system H protein